MRRSAVLVNIKKFQEQLIRVAQAKEKLSQQVIEAFYAVPRHLFVDQYFDLDREQWVFVNEKNLKEHLKEIYSDHPLVLFGPEKNGPVSEKSPTLSTISQPSFVLFLIDKLKLISGQKVFELGTGSGWNAVLMAHCVGSSGKVVSFEIIEELAESAKEKIKSLKIKNCFVYSGDAAKGFEAEAPYDRMVFTAGAFDLPSAFHEQIKPGGLVLFVLKNQGTDLLILLKKNENYFESLEMLPCRFVSMTGAQGQPAERPGANTLLPDNKKWNPVSYLKNKSSLRGLYLKVYLRSDFEQYFEKSDFKNIPESTEIWKRQDSVFVWEW